MAKFVNQNKPADFEGLILNTFSWHQILTDPMCDWGGQDLWWLVITKNKNKNQCCETHDDVLAKCRELLKRRDKKIILAC